MFTSVRLYKNYAWSLSLTAAVSLLNASGAMAELVVVKRGQTVPAVVGDDESFDSTDSSAELSAHTDEEDRLVHRDMLETAEKARTTLNARGGASNSPVVLIQSSPMASNMTSNTSANTSGVEVENVSKSELMRRERVRAELQNEDMLQERLEELRLRDERRRTDEILTSNGAATQVNQATAVATAGALQPQVVVVPPSDGGPAMVTPVAASTTVAYDAPTIDPNPIAITPRGGLSGMNNTDGFDVNSRFSAGVGMSVGIADNLSFEVGYTFSEYGVGMSNYNYYQSNVERLVMKQNVIDTGLKLHILGPDSRFRPFIGAGGGYSKSFINYDKRIIQALRTQGFSYMTSDYDVSSFLGYLSAGFDLKLSKTVNVGLMGRYYAVLSARENSKLNNAAFLGYNGYNTYSPYAHNNYGYNNYAYTSGYGVDAEKQAVGGSLANSSFYSAMATVSITF